MKENKQRVPVSACLLGEPCRYDGQAKPSGRVLALARAYELVSVCPEVLGGLPVPREPAERRGDRVFTRSGGDVTEAYRKGAEETLRIARESGCAFCVLKARSPSCGCGRIYDGTFSGTVVPGDGVAAELLKRHGFRVSTEEDPDLPEA